MKLSELVYQVVKNVIYLDDEGFSYEAFINGDYNSDQDYSNKINNAMTPINEAIHRLSDRNKIMYVVACIGCPNNNLIDVSKISKKIKKIKSIFYMGKDGYETTQFREYSKQAIIIDYVLNKPLFIQFVEDIKPFALSDIYNEDTDVDLDNKGISNTMCSYIIEYAQGKLLEPIAPELANMHITRAEQYFNDLEDQQTPFSQQVIKKKYRI